MKYTWITIGIVVALLGGWLITRSQEGAQAYCQSDGKLGSQKPIQSHRSYCVKSNASATKYEPNKAATYSFSLVDDQGSTLKDFETVHEKIMHVIVVRKDLANFQHIHPEYNESTGEFTLANLILPTDGPYRVFADFTPKTSQMGSDGQKLPVTLSEDVSVGDTSKYTAQSLGNAESIKTVNGYNVSLTTSPQPFTAGSEVKLSYSIQKDGKPVTNLEKYLGALGHTVIIKEGTLDFLHTHALSESTENQTGTVDFMATFPSPGKYKAFTQAQHSGQVFTVDFIVDVAQGAAETTSPSMDGMEDMPGMTH